MKNSDLAGRFVDFHQMKLDVERFFVGGRSKIILLGPKGWILGQWVNLFTPVCQYPD